MKGKGTSLASEIGGKIDDCMCSDPKKVYSKLHVQIGEGGIHLSKMINQWTSINISVFQKWIHTDTIFLNIFVSIF